MKRLIVIRHASYRQDDPLIDDINRPLDRHGQHHAAEAGTALAESTIRPEQIITSPALRAQETAMIIAEKVGLDPESVQIVDEIYEAERPQILKAVHQLEDAAETALLVGHHPGVSLLVNHLADSDVQALAMGAFVVLELNADRWQDVFFKRGELVDHQAPQTNAPGFGLWKRFTFWRRQRVEKIELAFVFVVSLLVILAIVALMISMNA